MRIHKRLVYVITDADSLRNVTGIQIEPGVDVVVTIPH